MDSAHRRGKHAVKSNGGSAPEQRDTEIESQAQTIRKRRRKEKRESEREAEEERKGTGQQGET